MRYAATSELDAHQTPRKIERVQEKFRFDAEDIVITKKKDASGEPPVLPDPETLRESR